jgi:hypothetical protein
MRFGALNQIHMFEQTCNAAEAAGRSPDAMSASASLSSMSQGKGPAAAATFRTKAYVVLAGILQRLAGMMRRLKKRRLS